MLAEYDDKGNFVQSIGEGLLWFGDSGQCSWSYSRQTVEVVCEAPEKPASRTSAQLNDHTDCGIGGRQYATSELIERP
jgi:hypothetical protein